MNRRLQQAVNPQRESAAEIKTQFFTFRDGDKVMQIKNNYDVEWTKDGEKGQGIFNGDIGTVVKVMRSEGRIIIDFDRRISDYSLESLDQLELAYAITVHKSQGSEFNAVIMPLLGGFERLYYRNLLYTAVTRAKKLLVIVGSSNVVKRMVENDRQTLRYSCLKDMIVASS
jgi:exodeoxyribonuclease V alpha subunit